jgi:hypothetical protein
MILHNLDSKFRIRPSPQLLATFDALVVSHPCIAAGHVELIETVDIPIILTGPFGEPKLPHEPGHCLSMTAHPFR